MFETMGLSVIGLVVSRCLAYRYHQLDQVLCIYIYMCVHMWDFYLCDQCGCGET